MARKLVEMVGNRRAEKSRESLSSTEDVAPIVGQVLTCEGYPDILLTDLGKDLSDALRSTWTTNDRPFQSGGVLDSAWLPPILGAGSTAMSALGAGNVFLATVDPKKLARYASGTKASFLKGAKGRIVGHAGFVAASQAIIPVVAPMMLFMVLSSTMLVRRLSRVEEKLGQLSATVERMRQLMEAEDYARFETAAEQIKEIQTEFGSHGRFASDAKSRVSLVDRDVNLLRHKYGRLATRDIASEDDARSLVADINRFYLSSVHDVQVDVLQLCLALQDDPTHVGRRQEQLQEKVERYRHDFKKIINEDRIGVLHRKLKGDLGKSTWNKVPWRARALKKRERDVQGIRGEVNSARARIESWIDAFASAADESGQESLVFYREMDGERGLRAYYTSDLQLEAVTA